MYFSTLPQLKTAIKNTQTIIVKIENGTKVGRETFDLEKFASDLLAILIEPVDGKIKIEQTRSIIDSCTTKQTSDRIFILDHAETLTTNAANCLLKLFEEPPLNYHFILLTPTPGAILQTIRSRATILAPRVESPLSRPPLAEKSVLEMAKKLLVAKPTDLPVLAETLNKKKPDVRRDFALKTLETTIELATKSYFKTENPAFAGKIQGLIAAHEGIKQNGNLKLQLLANLI